MSTAPVSGAVHFRRVCDPKRITLLLLAGPALRGAAADVSIRADTPMDPPRWAILERQLLDANVPACREFFTTCACRIVAERLESTRRA